MALSQDINPEVLSWAREQAGFSLAGAARALGYADSAKATAIEKLSAQESGAKPPTRTQLAKIAKVYKRPLITFFLPKAPVVSSKGEDFRRLQQPLEPREKGLLDALLRDVKSRQEMVRSLLEDEDASPIAFVGSMPVATALPDAVTKIRAFLTPKDGNLSAIIEPSKMFTTLRNIIEDQGVFVVLMGNLGTHHSNISEKIYRGFAIADQYAPFIVVNDQDAKTAQVFTLVHELVHIFLGSTGLSGPINLVSPQSQAERVEKFCNDVASEILLPSSSLSSMVECHNIEQAREAIQLVAKGHPISDLMVAYRLWRDDLISAAIYRELAAEFSARWKPAKGQKQTDKNGGNGGPDYFVLRRNKVGRALLNLIGQSIKSGDLTHTKAGKLLGVKATMVNKMLDSVPSYRGSHSLEADSK